MSEEEFQIAGSFNQDTSESRKTVESEATAAIPSMATPENGSV
jgi:hypothetical protein